MKFKSAFINSDGLYELRVLPSAEHGLFAATHEDRKWPEVFVGGLVVIHRITESDVALLNSGDSLVLDKYLKPTPEMLGEYTVTSGGLIIVQNTIDDIKGVRFEYFRDGSVLTEMAPFSSTAQQLENQV